MQIGRSVCSWTSVIARARRSASSVSGTPMLTSRTCPPIAAWSSTSLTISDRSPARSASANALRPVGLIRSPMMQNGWAGPMTTCLDRELRTVCICFSLLLARDAEVPAEARQRTVVPEVGEVKAANAGDRERLARLLEGELVRRLGLAFRSSDARDRLRGHGDPGDLAVHELEATSALDEHDRRQDCRA